MKEQKKLQAKLEKAIAKKDHVGVIKLLQQLKELEAKNEFKIIESRLDMTEIFGKMSTEYQDLLILNLNSIAVLVDWIEILTKRVNSQINSVAPTFKVHQYDEIIKLGRAAEQQEIFMFKNTGAEYQNAIAENSDYLLDKTIKGVKELIFKM